MSYEIHKFQWQGRTHRIYRRLRSNDGQTVQPGPGDPWYHRIGNTWTSIQTHVREDAVRLYKHHWSEHAKAPTPGSSSGRPVSSARPSPPSRWASWPSSTPQRPQPPDEVEKALREVVI